MSVTQNSSDKIRAQIRDLELRLTELRSQLVAGEGEPAPGLIPKAWDGEYSPSLLERERYRRIVEGLKDEFFFFATNREGIIIYISPSIESILGYRPDQMVSHNWRDFSDLSNPINQRVEEHERRRFAGEETTAFEFVANHNDGSIRVLEIRDFPVCNEHGEVISNEGVGKDITRRKEVELALKKAHAELEQRVRERTAELQRAYDELRKSQQSYQSVVEDQTEFIVRWRPNGLRTFVNQAYCRYAGQPRSELIGSVLCRMENPKDAEVLRARVEALTPEHPVMQDESVCYLNSGQRVLQHWTDRGIFDEEGHLLEIQSVGRDVTEQKRMEYRKRERAVAVALIEHLTPRERDVLRLVVAGDQNKVIARKLQLSIKTVEKHRSSLMRKLRVQSVAELVKLALQAEDPELAAAEEIPDAAAVRRESE